jgi:hypothetical protein
MGRKALIAFALAVLSVSAANGSATYSAKPHAKTASASAHHKKTRHPANHSTAHKSSQVSAHKHAANTVSRRKSRAATASPLRGSYESLERQNEKTENDNLERIEDDDDLADRIARNMLVPVPSSAALTVNGNLPANYRYCRPWTAQFLADLARSHQAPFHRPLEVSSAVRTVDYQKRLMEINGNAAAAEGDIASPHLTGATIDIAKSGMSRQEKGWMRSRLLRLQLAGMIDVEEEFHQSCFHITVYKSYAPPRPPSTRKPKQRHPAQPVQMVARERQRPPLATGTLASKN